MSTEPDVAPEIADIEPVKHPDEKPGSEVVKTSAHKIPPGLPKSILREYFESAVVTVIMALFGITFVVQAVKVPTGSMENTIKVGDHLLVNKWIFAPNHSKLLSWLPYRDIRRGDIIVFKYPGDTSVNYVKRVIGLPGEKIEIRGTQVYINDKPLPEQITWTVPPVNDKAELKPSPTREATVPPDNAYKQFYDDKPFRKYNVFYFKNGEYLYDDFEDNAPHRSTGKLDDVPPCLFNQEALDSNPGLSFAKFGVGRPCTIQEGQYFAMGDNRDNSQDSRFWGTVPRENIIGRALIVYWSLDEADLNDPNSQWVQSPDSSSFRRGVDTIKYFFTHTRWGDTGRIIK
ncbi:MAG TPA: signal peptidase I [Blastocatellia bacterium]|nr:signal peptidase I [Blastocatellia bacterium]